jgi:SbsC C-terminal domain/Delta endotoxin/Bacterial Ig-like domain (group 4)
LDLKKKVKKRFIATSTLIGSAIIAVQPASAERLTEAEKAVTSAEALAKALKWEVSIEYRKQKYPDHVTDYPNMKLFNDTKLALEKAKLAIKKLKGQEKIQLETRLQNNVQLYITRSIAYIDAITAGKKIEHKKTALEKAFNTNIQSDEAEKAYHELTFEIRKQTKLLDRVYGKSTRDLIREEYKKSAEKLVEAIKYTISVKIELDRAQEALLKSDSQTAKMRLDKAQGFLEKITNQTQLEQLNNTFNTVQKEWETKFGNTTPGSGGGGGVTPTPTPESDFVNFEPGHSYQQNFTFSDNTTYGPSEGTSTVTGNITLNGDITLQNINVNGIITVDPGNDGEVTLKNVNATNINVLSGAENTVTLDSVKANSLTVGEDDSIRILSQGETSIQTTLIESGVNIETQEGSLGFITLAPTNPSAPITLAGNFGNSAILVSNSSTVVAGSGFSAGSVTINSNNQNAQVSLAGNFSDSLIQINSPVQLAAGDNFNAVSIIVSPNNDSAPVGLTGNFGSAPITVTSKAYLNVTSLTSNSVNISPTNPNSTIQLNGDFGDSPVNITSPSTVKTLNTKVKNLQVQSNATIQASSTTTIENITTTQDVTNIELQLENEDSVENVLTSNSIVLKSVERTIAAIENIPVAPTINEVNNDLVIKVKTARNLVIGSLKIGATEAQITNLSKLEEVESKINELILQDIETKVLSLFKDGNKDQISDDVDQTKITSILNLVKVLTESDTKQAFLADVQKAQDFYEEKLKIQDAEQAVNALFTDGSKMKLKDTTTALVIQTAKTKVELLKDSSTKDALVANIEKAEELFDTKKQLISAQSAVQGLFADNENQNKLAAGVAQTSITQAQEKVNKLADTVQEKQSLLDAINKAQVLLNTKFAREAVSGLFNNSQKTELAEGIDQAKIDEVKVKVEALPVSVTERQGLINSVTNAQDLYNTKLIRELVSNLFKNAEKTELAEGVNQAKIDEVKAEIEALTASTAKQTLLSYINDAQILLDTKLASEAVAGLFNEGETELAAGIDFTKITEVESKVNELPDTVSAKTELLADIAKAKGFLDGVTVQEIKPINLEIDYRNNIQITLPNEVEVTYKNSKKEYKSVTWTLVSGSIPTENPASNVTIQYEGTIEGVSLKASATVVVKPVIETTPDAEEALQYIIENPTTFTNEYLEMTGFDRVVSTRLNIYRDAVSIFIEETGSLTLETLFEILGEVNALCAIDVIKTGEFSNEDLRDGKFTNNYPDRFEDYKSAIVTRLGESGNDLTREEIQDVINKVNFQLSNSALVYLNEHLDNFTFDDLTNVIQHSVEIENLELYRSQLKSVYDQKNMELSYEEVDMVVFSINKEQSVIAFNSGNFTLNDFYNISERLTFFNNTINTYHSEIQKAKNVKGSNLSASEIAVIINDINLKEALYQINNTSDYSYEAIYVLVSHEADSRNLIGYKNELNKEKSIYASLTISQVLSAIKKVNEDKREEKLALLNQNLINVNLTQLEEAGFSNLYEDSEKIYRDLLVQARTEKGQDLIRNDIYLVLNKFHSERALQLINEPDFEMQSVWLNHIGIQNLSWVNFDKYLSEIEKVKNESNDLLTKASIQLIVDRVNGDDLNIALIKVNDYPAALTSEDLYTIAGWEAKDDLLNNYKNRIISLVEDDVVLSKEAVIALIRDVNEEESLYLINDFGNFTYEHLNDLDIYEANRGYIESYKEKFAEFILENGTITKEQIRILVKQVNQTLALKQILDNPETLTADLLNDIEVYDFITENVELYKQKFIEEKESNPLTLARIMEIIEAVDQTEISKKLLFIQNNPDKVTSEDLSFVGVYSNQENLLEYREKIWNLVDGLPAGEKLTVEDLRDAIEEVNIEKLVAFISANNNSLTLEMLRDLGIHNGQQKRLNLYIQELEKLKEVGHLTQDIIRNAVKEVEDGVLDWALELINSSNDFTFETLQDIKLGQLIEENFTNYKEAIITKKEESPELVFTQHELVQIVWDVNREVDLQKIIGNPNSITIELLNRYFARVIEAELENYKTAFSQVVENKKDQTTWNDLYQEVEKINNANLLSLLKESPEQLEEEHLELLGVTFNRNKVSEYRQELIEYVENHSNLTIDDIKKVIDSVTVKVFNSLGFTMQDVNDAGVYVENANITHMHIAIQAEKMAKGEDLSLDEVFDTLHNASGLYLLNTGTNLTQEIFNSVWLNYVEESNISAYETKIKEIQIELGVDHLTFTQIQNLISQVNASTGESTIYVYGDSLMEGENLTLTVEGDNTYFTKDTVALIKDKNGNQISVDVNFETIDSSNATITIQEGLSTGEYTVIIKMGEKELSDTFSVSKQTKNFGIEDAIWIKKPVAAQQYFSIPIPNIQNMKIGETVQINGFEFKKVEKINEAGWEFTTIDELINLIQEVAGQTELKDDILFIYDSGAESINVGSKSFDLTKEEAIAGEIQLTFSEALNDHPQFDLGLEMYTITPATINWSENHTTVNIVVTPEEYGYTYSDIENISDLYFYEPSEEYTYNYLFDKESSEDLVIDKE